MNLTGRPIYQKGKKSPKRGARQPKAEEKRLWKRVLKLPCIVAMCGIWPVTLHHCGTGAGGRKNHKKVLPLCWEHHLGDVGINSLTGKISRRAWEARFGTEAELLKKRDRILEEQEKMP
jgi:hypothetical protein